jgi:hypothetical protein
MNRESSYFERLSIQHHMGDQLVHATNCMAVPGLHHPLAGPNMLCTCNAVESLLQQQIT